MKTKKLIASLLIIALLTTFIPVVSKAANPTMAIVGSDGSSTVKANVNDEVVLNINVSDFEANQKFIGFIVIISILSFGISPLIRLLHPLHIVLPS